MEMMQETIKSRYDSIIFDLDGTLWDITANVAIAWQTAIDSLGYVGMDVTRELIRSVIGKSYDVIMDKLFPNLDQTQRKEVEVAGRASETAMLQRKGGDLYPRLKETLEQLKSKYRLFIVSNSPSGYIELFLELNGLQGYFHGHQCQGTKGNPKADNIVDIVNDHQLLSPVYVGDTKGDYDAATQAGIPFIFAGYGFGNVSEGMVATVANLADLQDML